MQVAAVFGNNDGERLGLTHAFRKFGWRLEGDFLSLEVDGRRIAVYHGTVGAITEALIDCGHYDVVITGHTHEPVNRMAEETLVLNPGTAHGFGERATVMILDALAGRAELIEL